MALIKSCNQSNPVITDSSWLADNATIIGDVSMGEECSIWFNAVVRGDVNSIVLGNRVNVQDGAVLHCTYQKTRTVVGNNVSIGHNAIVHGCNIHDDVLIGMGSIVMDHCEVEKNVIVAAGAVVLENTKLETGWIYAGVPARKVKEVPNDLKEGEIERIANNYIHYANWFKS